MSEIEVIDTAVGSCRLRRSNRRTLAISVLPDGQVELMAPRAAGHDAIAAKVSKRLRWIEAQRRRFAQMNRDRSPLRYESGATHRYLGRQYRLKVSTGEDVGVRFKGAFFTVTSRSGAPGEVANLLGDWLRTRARALFQERLSRWDRWCLDRGLPVPRLLLLRMPKRWGSAHRDGRIYLNPELARAPSACVDYVIAHEVCHLEHPTHDNGFYRTLSELVPDWQRIKARLERTEFR